MKFAGVCCVFTKLFIHIFEIVHSMSWYTLSKTVKRGKHSTFQCCQDIRIQCDIVSQKFIDFVEQDVPQAFQNASSKKSLNYWPAWGFGFGDITIIVFSNTCKTVFPNVRIFKHMPSIQNAPKWQPELRPKLAQN